VEFVAKKKQEEKVNKFETFSRVYAVCLSLIGVIYVFYLRNQKTQFELAQDTYYGYVEAITRIWLPGFLLFMIICCIHKLITKKRK